MKPLAFLYTISVAGLVYSLCAMADTFLEINFLLVYGFSLFFLGLFQATARYFYGKTLKGGKENGRKNI